MSTKPLSLLRVKNFQSLKDVKLDISSTITTIIGKTDSGKSAILRALRALCFNASGSDFVTFGESKTSVKGIFGDDSVVWEKGDKLNRFILSVGGIEKIFDKVGKSTPEEVVDLLQVKDVVLDDNKLRINFADQFDPPFLLWESGVKASKILGKLTNLDSIYEALGECSRDVKRLKSDLKSSEESIEAKRQKLLEFDGVDEEKARLQGIQDSLDSIKVKQAKCDFLAEVKQRLDSLIIQKKSKADKLLDNKTIFVDTSKLSERMKTYLFVKELKVNLVGLKSKRQALKDRCSEQGANVSAYEDKLKVLRQTISVCPLCHTNLRGVA